MGEVDLARLQIGFPLRYDLVGDCFPAWLVIVTLVNAHFAGVDVIKERGLATSDSISILASNMPCDSWLHRIQHSFQVALSLVCIARDAAVQRSSAVEARLIGAAVKACFNII
jgi:hypothetical protein